jgi:hypothetical protein
MLVDDDVLGAWLLGVFLHKHGFLATEELVDAWAGDHLWIYRNAAGDRAWLWQLSFRTEDAAADVERGIQQEPTSSVVVQRAAHRLLVTTAGAPPELAEAGRAFLTETTD